MNLANDDLQELADSSTTAGCYFDHTLGNGIAIETLGSFFHDMYGWHALIQVWDPRDKSPYWRFAIIFFDGYRIHIIKTFDDRTLWGQGAIPYVEFAKIVEYWRHFGERNLP